MFKCFSVEGLSGKLPSLPDDLTSAALLWTFLYLSSSLFLFSFFFFTPFLIFFLSLLIQLVQCLFHLFPSDLFRSQMSCLMFAAKSGFSKVINLLISYGAEINAQDHYGYTVSHYCSSSHCILSGINYPPPPPPSGSVYSGATQQTGGSTQAPSAGSRQNLNHQNWQVPC